VSAIISSASRPIWSCQPGGATGVASTTRAAPQLPGNLAGGSGRRPGGDAIVNDQGGLSVQRHTRAAIPVGQRAAA